MLQSKVAQTLFISLPDAPDCQLSTHCLEGMPIFPCRECYFLSDTVANRNLHALNSCSLLFRMNYCCKVKELDSISWVHLEYFNQFTILLKWNVWNEIAQSRASNKSICEVSWEIIWCNCHDVKEKQKKLNSILRLV